MNQSAILALAIVLSSVLIVSGTNIYDKAPCEPQINTSLGKEFTISLDFNPPTFEWWTNFDPNYLSLLNSTFISGNEKSGMLGFSGKKLFTFNTRNAGNTEVIMLLLRPWENGTIAERKAFPINIISTAATLKQVAVQNKIANIEPIIPINVNSAASALKQATVQTKSLNHKLISTGKHVQEQGYQEPSVMEPASQIVNRNIQGEKNPNLRATELLNNTVVLNK
jgi:predicted secreted protein